jgi:acetylornithine/succinyldiaminopimelate/putrescine aminotransferase
VCPHRVGHWSEVGVPLVIGRREGPFMWDLDGHRLYDLHLNGGTFNLGHRHPELIAALVEGAGEYDIGNHHFPSAARARLAEDLARLTPGDLTYSVLAPSGGEAVDIAIKSARRATGRTRIVSFEHGYHGRTGLSGTVGDDSDARYFLSDRPGESTRVPFADAGAVERALAAGDVAAVLLETIPATWGFAVPPVEYLRAVAALAHAHGALYIADEVQTGLGRTGRMWAVEELGIEPDILITGKGLSGGIYPMAATVLGERASVWLREHGWAHVSTFGGSELGCRVAQKVLEITTRPETRRNVDALAAAFARDLEAVRRDDEYLAEIRQRGLVMGLRFAHPTGAVYMQRALYDQGVWAIASGFDQSVLQFKPPLVMAPETVGDVVERLVAAMAVAREQDYAVVRRRPRDAARA